jgi:hypothetical protein
VRLQQKIRRSGASDLVVSCARSPAFTVRLQTEDQKIRNF